MAAAGGNQSISGPATLTPRCGGCSPRLPASRAALMKLQLIKHAALPLRRQASSHHAAQFFFFFCARVGRNISLPRGCCKHRLSVPEQTAVARSRGSQLVANGGCANARSRQEAPLLLMDKEEK